MMTWIGLYLTYTLICIWIVLGNGSEHTLGLIFAALLGADPRMSEQGVKTATAFTWVCVTAFFYWKLYSLVPA